MQVFQNQLTANISIAKILNMIPKSLFSRATPETRKAENNVGNESETTNTRASLGSRLYDALSCNVKENDILFNIESLDTDICLYNINTAIKLFNDSIKTYGYETVFQELVAHMTEINSTRVIKDALENYDKMFRKAKYAGPDENPQSFDVIVQFALFEYIVTYCDISSNWELLTNICYTIDDSVYTICNSNAFDEFRDNFCKRHNTGARLIDKASSSYCSATTYLHDYNYGDQYGDYISQEEHEDLKAAVDFYWDEYRSAKKEFIELYSNKSSKNS